jgi:hypothetical protein
MAVNPGFFSNAIIGEQVDFDTCLTSATVIQKVWEFRSASIRNRGPKATPARFKGNRSPSGLIEGFYHAEGDIVLDAHANDLGVWIKQALHTVTPASVAYNAGTPVSVLTATTWAASGSKKSLTTQPTATTPAMDPGKLTITFRATGGAPKVYTGNVVVEGTDQNDIEITEIVPFVAASAATTAYYFKTVDASGVTINCTPLLADDTIDITCYKGTTIHTFALGDAILPGMTMELLKGTIPSVGVGMIINTMRMDIGDVLGLTFGMLGKRLWNRYKLPTGATDPIPSTTGTSQAALPHPGELVFPAWGLALYIDASASATPIASGSFSTSNGLRTPRRYRGLRTEPQPIAGDLRESVLTVGIDYDTVNADFDAKALANGEVDIDLIGVCSPYAGPEYSFTISMPRCQIPDFPDPDVNNFGEVIQELTFRSIRTAIATTSDELVFTLQNTKAAYNTV